MLSNNIFLPFPKNCIYMKSESLLDKFSLEARVNEKNGNKIAKKRRRRRKKINNDGGAWRHMLEKNKIATGSKWVSVCGMLIIMTLFDDKKFNIYIFSSLSDGESNWVISKCFEHRTAAKIIIDTIYDIGCIDICAATHHDYINCHNNGNSRFIIIKFQFTASYHNDEEIETKNFVANTTRTAAMSGEWSSNFDKKKAIENNCVAINSTHKLSSQYLEHKRTDADKDTDEKLVTGCNFSLLVVVVIACLSPWMIMYLNLKGSGNTCVKHCFVKRQREKSA